MISLRHILYRFQVAHTLVIHANSFEIKNAAIACRIINWKATLHVMIHLPILYIFAPQLRLLLVRHLSKFSKSMKPYMEIVNQFILCSYELLLAH